MKILLTILMLTFASVVTAQHDTMRLIDNPDFVKLTKKIDNTQYNLGMYASKRRAAYAWAGLGAFSYVAVTAYNKNTNNVPSADLYYIPAVFGVVAIIKYIAADKYLRRAGIELTPTGVKVKF